MGNSCCGRSNRVADINIARVSTQAVGTSLPSLHTPTVPTQHTDFAQQCYDGRSTLQLQPQCVDFQQQFCDGQSRPSSVKDRSNHPIQPTVAADGYCINDFELIITLAKELEAILTSFGATGEGLGQKVRSVGRLLPSEVFYTIKNMARMRNRVVHDTYVKSLSKYERQNFITSFENVKLQLGFI